MKSILYIKLENSTAHRHSRNEIMQLALDSNKNLMELIEVAFDITDKNHYKACWALELVLQKDILLLSPFIDKFIEVLPLYNHDGALRSMSKITMLIAYSKLINDNEKIKKITDVCFEWLALAPKVVTKCYSGYALNKFSVKIPEIKPLLKEILEEDYTKYSFAYQAMARDVFKML